MSDDSDDLLTQRLRLVVTGGGTGGHVQPLVATLGALRERVTVDAMWIGSGASIEREAAAQVEATYHRIEVGKLRRYFSWRTPVDGLRIPIGIAQASLLLRRFQPDVVFSTGGFVGVPAVVAARFLGIPSVTHEQTVVVGLATKINARFCDLIAVSHESSLSLLGPHRSKAIVTGNPIRLELLQDSPKDAYASFGLSSDLPVIYITGGTLGAHAINLIVADALPQLVESAQVVHQCGSSATTGDEEMLQEARLELPSELRQRYVVQPSIGAELPALYAAATLVVGRAGAGTVAELAALGKPSILIPLPGTGGDEQTANARHLVAAGAATMIEQKDLTTDRLVHEIQWMLKQHTRDALGAAARKVGHAAAAECLADAIIRLAHTAR